MVNAVLAAVVGISFYTDVKHRKIYNSVVGIGIISALAYYWFTGGLEGLIFSLRGFLTGTGIFILPFIMGGSSAGDVKLLGAIGALKGASFALQTFLTAALIGGVPSVVVLIKEGRLLRTLKHMSKSFLFFLFSKSKINYLNHRHINPEGSFPYGIAIALGTLLSFFWEVKILVP